MLPGFPKQVNVQKLGRGHYRLCREDGVSVEVRKDATGRWCQIGNMSRGKTLRGFRFDLRHGFTAADQLEVSE